MKMAPMAPTPVTSETDNDGDEPLKRTRRGRYFGDVVERRIARRKLIQGAGALGAGLVIAPGLFAPEEASAHGRRHANHDPGKKLRFETVAPSDADAILVPDDYEHQVLIKWGEPLFPGAPAFDPDHQNGARQSQQFGFNCDFIAHYNLPRFIEHQARHGRRPSSRALDVLGLFFDSYQKSHSDDALLWVNHEYTTGGDMFPGYVDGSPTQDQVEAEIAAHGASILAIRRRRDGSWSFDRSSPFNRRITGSTPIEITGPLAGHPLLQTTDDPTGTRVKGMFNNCGGGTTDWGTNLSAEENFDQYFGNFGGVGDPVKRALYERLPPGNGASGRRWELFDTRFDVSLEPNEYARFGYIVEHDVYDPTATPRKRTALGRFKHEAAVQTLSKHRRAVVYMGDDARFEYVYKFVSAGRYSKLDRRRNMDLLDEGTLYVARLNDDGTGEWLPVVHGNGDIDEANGFPSQAEVLVNTRGAADRLGPTEMDRPEDIEVSPTTGKVYVALTNNDRRTVPNGPNPRVDNDWGHIVEITEDRGDNGSLTFRWEIFILCGDPSVPSHQTYFAGFDPTQVSPIAAPDNLDFDRDGNLWIATDGQPSKAGFGQNDAIHAVPTEGRERGHLRQFLSAVKGCEVASLKVTGDQKTLFATIQHPGEDGGFPNAVSAWPDGNAPAKPSVIAVWHEHGKKIGS